MTAAAARSFIDVGADEAAAALGRLLRVPVAVEGAVRVDVAALANDPHFGHQGTHVVVVAADTTGGVVGTFALIVDDGVAAWLVARLTGEASASATLTPIAFAALAELGNIAASAFLNGCARVVGKTCLPSVPRVSRGRAGDTITGTLPVGVADVVTLRAQQQRVSLVFAR